jgi:hypothetical protein
MSKHCALYVIALLPACGDPSTVDDPHRPKPKSPATTVTTALSPVNSAEAPSPEDAASRRSYGWKDIKLAPCLTKSDNDSIQAKGCDNGIVTYGPYITAPANSELSFSFDVKTTAPISIGSDIVSHGGQGFTHAAIDPILIEPGSFEHVGYKVRFFERATDTEARIMVHAKASTAFTLTNINVTVR